jgi:pimeloyl-ACP methyl ester carboxylesterase
MNPDGTINTTLWRDFASRGIHEMAVKSKALATEYYGRAPQFSYWEGGSTGGRQGLKLAQDHPEDFDGIVANFPAINWSKFITAELYPQIVFQRDLAGVPLTRSSRTWYRTGPSTRAMLSAGSISDSFWTRRHVSTTRRTTLVSSVRQMAGPTRRRTVSPQCRQRRSTRSGSA